MGLDMYLFERIKLENPDTPADKWETAVVDLGYWRKANQVHAWFVENVQGGVDECEAFRVTIEHLATLRGLCDVILSAVIDLSAEEAAKVAKDLLPPREGFFFGGYEIDEYYYSDIQQTLKICDDVIAKMQEAEVEGEPMTVFYQSSW